MDRGSDVLTASNDRPCIAFLLCKIVFWDESWCIIDTIKHCHEEAVYWGERACL